MATENDATMIVQPRRGNAISTTEGSSVNAHTTPGVFTLAHPTAITQAMAAFATVRSSVHRQTAIAASA